MKSRALFLFAILICVLAGTYLGQTCRASSATQPAIVVTPLLKSATMDDGYGHIPFKIENQSSTSMIVSGVNWARTVDLMTTADSGDRVPLEEYRRGIPMGGGGPYAPTLLKPGESGTYSSSYSIETLSLLMNKNKEVFGEVLASPAGANQKPQEYDSDPFPVTPDLITPPWTDLGEQNYLTVTADATKVKVAPHTLYRGVWLRGSVIVPIWVKNDAGQPYIVATHGVSFFIAGNDGKRVQPSPWGTMKAMKPILKPGESAAASCDVDLDWLKSQDYKPGDKLVAAVGGRIPNSNQVFECYSAPFELPPLPKEKPPKGAVEIPGL